MTILQSPSPKILLHAVFYSAELKELLFFSLMCQYLWQFLLVFFFHSFHNLHKVTMTIRADNAWPEVVPLNPLTDIMSSNSDLQEKKKYHLTISYTLRTTKTHGADVSVNYPQWCLGQKTVIIFQLYETCIVIYYDSSLWIKVIAAYYDVGLVFLTVCQVLDKRKNQLSLKHPVLFCAEFTEQSALKVRFLILLRFKSVKDECIPKTSDFVKEFL